jgi:DNA polymerase-3 subunit gamma/tau
MSYTVLARRYRSREFTELVGQEAIARTVRNAIAQDRVAHAYLFVGTRGVGKTTMARLLAKELNGGGDAAVGEAIMTGQDTDVVEIDAASNRGVDEARELIANSVYRPLRGRYKVYIVDEVHMLTREAFNALLKIMEEPPSHVKFILCTTEAHKVPATIQSRCQRFDFRRLSSEEIAKHLAMVCKTEKIGAEPAALGVVARLGNGSMRDALSLLDRLMAACDKGEKITVGLIETVMGLPPSERMESLVDAMADGDASAALVAMDAVLGTGVEGEQALESLAERLRDLMVLAVCGGDTALVEMAGDARERAVAQSARFDGAGLVHMVALVESAGRMCRTSASPRALIDALVVRLAMTEKLADVGRLLAGEAPPAAAAGSSRAGRGSAPVKKR